MRVVCMYGMSHSKRHLIMDKDTINALILFTGKTLVILLAFYLIEEFRLYKWMQYVLGAL